MRPRTRSGWYELVIGAALTVMVLYAIGTSSVPDILAGAEDRGHSPAWVAVSLLCFVVSAWIAGWYFAGPLAVPAARLHWLVWRQDPETQVRSAAVQVVLISAALAAVVAGLAGLALATVGLPAVAPAVIVWVTLELLVVATMLLQRRDLDASARWAAYAAGVVGVIVAAGEAWGAPALAAGGAVTVVGAVVVGAARRGTRVRPSAGAWRGVAAELTPRWQLHRGARHRWAVNAGITLMEGDVVRVVRQRDQKARRRPLPAAAYRLRRPLGLSAVVLLRSLRSVAAIAGIAVPLAFAAHEILGTTPAVVVIVLAHLALATTTARAAETWLASEALPRIWGTGGHDTAVALAAPYVAVCVALTATVVIGLPLPPAVGIVLAALPVTILLRRRSARRPATGLTLVSTPMGALSVQSLNKVTAGPDVVLLAILLADGLS